MSTLLTPTVSDLDVAWADVIVPGDTEAFGKRLLWSGWDIETARAYLDSLPFVDADAWEAERRAAYALPVPDDEGDIAEIPFGDVLAPLVRESAHRMAELTGGGYSRLAPAVQASFERSLLERLLQITGRALYHAFSVERTRLRHAAPWLALTGGDRTYRSVAGALKADALGAFFQRYPVAARLCQTACAQWRTATAEFLDRLVADGPSLAEGLGNPLLGERPEDLADVGLSLSDPHYGGRTVIVATFASGARVVYKPRPIELDAFFARFVEWFNERSGDLALTAPAVYARQGYGWLSFVESAACEDHAGARRYYRRAGALLALVYGLNGSDFHYENLLARGEHPVLLDFEAVLVPKFSLTPDAPHPAPREVARLASEETVLRTAMLPSLRLAENGEAVDLGGLAGGPTDYEARLPRWGWKAPNTDQMRMVQAECPPPPRHNAPVVDGRRVDAGSCLDEVVAGFEAAYRVLLEHRDDLLADGGLLDELTEAPTRFVFRPTNLYGALLERTFRPEYLSSEADRFVQLDALARALLHCDEVPAVWPILASEHAQLAQGDVPCFMVPAGSRDLPLPDADGEPETFIPNVFEASALDEARRRLGSLSPADLTYQTRIVHAAFCARQSSGLVVASDVEASRERPASSALEATEPSPDLAIEFGTAIGEMLLDQALATPAGTLWPGLSFHPDSGRYRLDFGHHGLFDGRAGVALFFGVLAATTGEARWADAARTAADPIARAATAATRFLRWPELGVGNGPGGATYALTHLSRLLGDEAHLEDALRVAACATSERIRADHRLNALAGVAGLILGLRPLYDATGDAGVLDRMREAAVHLIAKGEDAELPAGLALGRSGIGLALARLHAVDPDERWAEACREILAPLPALPTDPAARASWASGAAGEVLARREAATSVSGADVAVDALEAELDPSALTTDDACGGRVGVWAAASPTAATPDFLALIESATDPGGRGLRLPWAPEYAHPGLYQGAAGVALIALQRAVSPSLPDLLTWSP